MYYFVLILLSIGVEPCVERWKAKIPVMGNRVAFAGVQVLRTWILVAIGELFFGQRGFGRESGCSAL